MFYFVKNAVPKRNCCANVFLKIYTRKVRDIISYSPLNVLSKESVIDLFHEFENIFQNNYFWKHFVKLLLFEIIVFNIQLVLHPFGNQLDRWKMEYQKRIKNSTKHPTWRFLLK